MKKSEMIDYLSLNTKLDKVIIMNVLDLVEKKGMLPPHVWYDSKSKKFLKSEFDGNFFTTDLVNEWETSNE